ncbi:hypothetical protein EC912_102700 [Luteibacter rhizovicinus]|uniref:Uncharacterized protein n=1 Tax=Luteibacter rhizovicinus TaxID=242606 RepID=A0A4V2W4L6_9GAMM|nr:hypothetical protein [Luteibacter rhizovicinus]TCV96349.1 hypothetical protein EC912_102700 [Luteibacter rhizovicinus]
MNRITRTEDALTFVREHGVVLVSAKGGAPRLTEAIVGESIRGSWWAHPEGRRIFAILSAIAESDQVLVCRLVDGKLTMVHRRLWPSLVRAAEHFVPDRITQVHQEHTASGKHVNREIPFPQWVPESVTDEAGRMAEQEAVAPFIEWVKPSPGR